jgi:hypothetical protein
MATLRSRIGLRWWHHGRWLAGIAESVIPVTLGGTAGSIRTRSSRRAYLRRRWRHGRDEGGAWLVRADGSVPAHEIWREVSRTNQIEDTETF